MDKIKAQRESFENRAEDYYVKRTNKNCVYLKNLMWEDFFENKDYLNKKNMLILEPMCGYGDGKKILEENLKFDFTYRAFDYSEILVNKAKKDDPNLDIWVMDVTKFCEVNKYDIIIIIGSLHHVPDYCQDVVNNIYSALKPGGYFINCEPTSNNFLFKKIGELIYKRNKNFDEDTEVRFDLKQLNNYYLNAGFKIEDQMYQGLSSYILFYNPNAFSFLNKGNEKVVYFFYSIDKFFFRNIIGKLLSFSTTTLLAKEQV